MNKGLCTSWQGYSNTWRKHKILIIDSKIQWIITAILKNGLQDINRSDIRDRYQDIRDSVP